MYGNHVMLKNMSSDIQIKRAEMLQIAGECGYTDDKTIKSSQELDQLIYEYQKMTKERNVYEELLHVFSKITIGFPKSVSQYTLML